jgi:hypothetical protein
MVGYRVHLAAAAAALIALIGTASAQSRGTDSAEQNVRESQQYEQLLCSNPAFRAKRVAIECGPLQGSDMYNSCVASFQCGGPRHRASQKAPPSETIR